MSIATNDFPSGSRSGTYFKIVAGVMAAAMIAVVALLATIVFYLTTDRLEAAKAKESEVDISELESQVTRGIQGMLNRNDRVKEYGIRYSSDMTLFQVTEGGSEYRGMVTARTPGGSETSVSVTVFADDTGALMYQVDTSDLVRLTEMADDE